MAYLDGPCVQVYGDGDRPVPGFEQIASFEFASKLPGGLSSLSAVSFGDWAARIAEQEARQIVYAEVTGPGEGVLWSGRVAQRQVELERSIVTFGGWWNDLNKVIWGYEAGHYASPTYPGTVIAGIVQQAGKRLDSSLAGIGVNPIDLAAGLPGGGTLAQLDLRTAREVLEALCMIGGTSNEQWFAAVWEDRRMVYAPRRSEPNWEVDLSELDPGWSFTVDDTRVYSSVLLTFTDTTGAARRLLIGDTHTEAEVLRGVGATAVQPLPNDLRFTDDTARKVGELFLSEHARPQQRSGQLATSLDVLRDGTGGRKPAYLMRAGDVVEITGLPPSPVELPDTLDGLRRLCVIECTWQSLDPAQGGQGQLRFTPDYTGLDIVSTFARQLGIAPLKQGAA